ncbi:hypothetical protein BS78_03G242000 [Paspalum vaginatum]|nr:hypothetical protein BS78_03G242000 [Paspalum vaginatum]
MVLFPLWCGVCVCVLFCPGDWLASLVFFPLPPRGSCGLVATVSVFSGPSWRGSSTGCVPHQATNANLVYVLLLVLE